jgi:hypothetical protein
MTDAIAKIKPPNFTLQRTGGSRCSPRPLSVALEGRTGEDAMNEAGLQAQIAAAKTYEVNRTGFPEGSTS